MADDDYAEERNMNDTTMPPPPKSNATRTVTKSTGGTPVRNKVRLRKGFGLGDWHRLLKSSKDLAQRKGEGLRRIKWDEIKQHTAIYDGWTVLKGKVYFISPYLAYHPGGEAIMHKILGKDCTALFEKYHRWVNEDGLIEKLHIGFLDRTPSVVDDEERRSYLPQTITQDKDGFAMPAPRPPKAMTEVLNKETLDEQDDELDLNPWEMTNPK